LDGAIFFRAEFTERWAYRSPTPDQLTQILRPGAARLIIFHIVAAGACWVRVDRGERLWAREGDVIVVPYGDQHAMGGTETADEISLVELFDPPPWRTLPVLHHGDGGRRTDIVCGYLHSEHPLFNPVLHALRPLFLVRPPEGPAAAWIRSSVEYALATASPLPRDDPTATRLSELVLLETLRLHLATAPAIDTGWLAALTDPVLAPAMARLHAAPARRWTVEQLARSVAVSRSVAGAGPIADSVSDRLAHASGRGPARRRTVRGGRGAPGRLWLGGVRAALTASKARVRLRLTGSPSSSMLRRPG